MKFLRSRAAMIFIALISVLCLVAAAIAIDVSIVMIKKKDQAIKPEETGHIESIQASSKPVKASKLEENVLYFNGIAVDGFRVYSGSNNSLFIPIDLLLQKLNIKYRCFASDDIVEFRLSDKKVTLQINKQDVAIGDKKVEFDFPVIAAKGHILVPADMFNYLGDFTMDRLSDRKTVFMNYYPDVKKAADGIRAIRTENGSVEVSDLSGDELVWKKSIFTNNYIEADVSENNNNFLIKIGSKVYLIQAGNMAKPCEINVNPAAAWSVDGKYLYWEDSGSNISYLYDINTRITKKLGDYFQRTVKPDSSNRMEYGNSSILYDYSQGRRYKRIVLAGAKNSTKYISIERNGKSIIEGQASFSPDLQSILYYKAGEGFYTASTYGTKQAFIGAGAGAVWINNYKILLYGSKENCLVSKDGNYRTKISGMWKLLGQTPKGEVFYTDGNILYSETEGKEVQLSKLDFPCDFMYGLNVKGPYLAFSKGKDTIHLINKGKTSVIANISSLIKKGIPDTWNKCILSSPKGKYTVFGANADGLAGIDILDNSSGEFRRISLNCTAEDAAAGEIFNIKWVNDNVFIACTTDKSWIISMGEEIRIYSWGEKSSSKIAGILLK